MTDTPPPPVHVAWSNAMEDLREIRKGERASGGGTNYSFRGVDTVMNACGPVFRDHGLFVLPSVREAKHRDFTSKNGTTMHEAIVTVDYTIHGPAGDTMTGCSIGESADASDKATAQAMSVAYRTFLLQAMTMPTDDPDPDNSHTDRAGPGEQVQAPQDAPKPEFTDAERAEAWAMLHGLMAEVAEPDFSKIVATLEGAGINEDTLTRAAAAGWYDAIEKAPKRKAEQPSAATADAKSAGWRSDAERTAMWESLNERHDNAVKAWEGGEIPENLSHNPDEAAFTKAHAETWLANIIELELGAPF